MTPQRGWNLSQTKGRAQLGVWEEQKAPRGQGRQEWWPIEHPWRPVGFLPMAASMKLKVGGAKPRHMAAASQQQDQPSSSSHRFVVDFCHAWRMSFSFTDLTLSFCSHLWPTFKPFWMQMHDHFAQPLRLNFGHLQTASMRFYLRAIHHSWAKVHFTKFWPSVFCAALRPDCSLCSLIDQLWFRLKLRINGFSQYLTCNWLEVVHVLWCRRTWVTHSAINQNFTNTVN